MDNDIFKVYITKYALTSGIIERYGILCKESANMVECLNDDLSKTQYGCYYHGKDWHRTKESAIAQAEEMREKKLKSLNKKISKIKNLKFEL